MTLTVNDVDAHDDGASESVPTYSEAFPPLSGSSKLTEIASSLAENEWHNPKMKRIRTTVVTQVRSVLQFSSLCVMVFN